MFLIKRIPLSAMLLVVMLGSSLLMAQNRGPVEFSLHTIEGQTITSDSLKGEVVVLGEHERIAIAQLFN